LQRRAAGRCSEPNWPTMNHYADAKTDIIEHLIAQASAKP